MISMPFHMWDCNNDFEYCELKNCKIIDDTIVLDNSLTGTVVSDIRDSTEYITKYKEVIPKIITPPGTSVDIYIRTGTFEKYYDGAWTDWKLFNNREKIVESTLSLTSTKVLTNYDIYDIESLVNIHDKFTESEVIGEALTDEACTDISQTDISVGTTTIYATEATFDGNMVILKNPLNEDNVPLVVVYYPLHGVYSDTNYRYIQWKCELKSDSLSYSPGVEEFSVGYELKFYDELIKAFPGQFRRL